MKYNGKYSLKTYMLNESGEVRTDLLEEGILDWFVDKFSSEPEKLPEDGECIADMASYTLHHDSFYGLPVQSDKDKDCVTFKPGTTDDEKRRSLKQLKDQEIKYSKKSDKEMEEFRSSHMSEYEKKWQEAGSKVAEVNSTKKIETYRDLRTLLLGMTLTEEEVDEAYRRMKKEGWTGFFWRSGFKICKFMLSKVSGLQDITQAMGLVKDIGEEAFELMDVATLQPDDVKKAKSNPMSDALSLHPDYSTIIDPDLEQDIFRDLIEELNQMDEAGDLDAKIPEDEMSFTDYTETYLENEIGDKATGLHGADEAGGTTKLSDISIPKLDKYQYDLFTDWLEAAGKVLYNYGAEIA